MTKIRYNAESILHYRINISLKEYFANFRPPTTTGERPVQKVLLIDDDDTSLRLVKLILGHAGYEVYTARGGPEGLGQFQAHQPDLVILDLLMPEVHGWQICQQLRQYSNVPILILTAMSGADNTISSLDAGADDYLEKPIEARVLLARVRALLRRSGRPPRIDQPSLFSDGYLTIDLTARQVLINNQPVELTPTEYALLVYLFQRAGQVCLYQQILGEVWKWEQHPIDVVHQNVRRLRRKLKESSAAPRYLLTEYGVGYRFKK
jgi:two-component system KDP operon response regulator KdpE